MLMYTYNDLMEQQDEYSRQQFILSAINRHESSPQFKIGAEAGQFYRHRDPELEAYQKIVYDMQGNPHIDEVSPNHKITSNFYYIFTTQVVTYLLGNGISFDNEAIKQQLGNNFDYDLQNVLLYAINDGVSFAFVTNNGIKPLCFACNVNGKEPYFVPLYDEDDGKLKAGIRYWRLSPDKPRRITLYEIDGYTEYKESKEGNILEILEEKKKYNSNIISNDAEGIYNIETSSYDELPIAQMNYINGQSSLVGNKATLVAYDMVLSGFVNDVDMNLVYWILKNAGGMDEVDDMQFITNLIKNRILHLDDDVEAQPQQFELQFEAKQAILQQLEERLIADFQAVDTKNLRNGAITTVEIRESYEAINRKCDELEKYLGEFIRSVLRISGFDENEPFHFQRATTVNESEVLQNIIASAPYMGDEATTKAICEVMGKIDEFEAIQAQKSAEELSRFSIADTVTETSQDDIGADNG